MDDLSSRIQVKERRDWNKRKYRAKRTKLYIDEGLTIGDVSRLLDIPIEIIERIRREYGR